MDYNFLSKTTLFTGCTAKEIEHMLICLKHKVKKFEEYFYIQVTYSVAEEKSENREFGVFEKIRDNYPKYLLTLDPLLQTRDGIFHKNLIKFLKDDYKL